jgi:uncharacterized protein (DUF1778 family)
MATTKPRITVTLQPHSYDVIRRLAAAGGETMSKIVGDMLDVAIPSLERVVLVMEQAASMSQEAREGMRASFARAEADMAPGLANLIEQRDAFIDDVVGAIEPDGKAKKRLTGAGEGAPAATARTAPAAAKKAKKEGSTPVPVTRGSGTESGRIARAQKGKGERRSGVKNALA